MPQFKLGALTPIFKLGKQPTNPDHTQRITVCSMIGKVAEKVVTVRARKVLDLKQYRVQFGFTEGCSPSTCALVLTEAMAEAPDRDGILYVMFMDIKKAFDTVCHNSMLISLYDQGVDRSMLNIFRDMYLNIRSQVKL